ncbi:gamma-glutamyl-gamma-aminobutyrate hydrolase family protein [bacterium]|nr:gamma-glutamyl-gamma-aminobutyrate hydrolase family protein [bacterium]
MKPVIGITCSHALAKKRESGIPDQSFDLLKNEYSDIVHRTGGIPLLIPNLEHPEGLENYAGILDGLLLSGGGDVHPSYFGQENTHSTYISKQRDVMEFELLKLCENIPILGICRGLQLINIFYGGTLHQDFSVRDTKCILHRGIDLKVTYHQINIEENSALRKILNTDRILVDSSHHQVLDAVPESITPVAYAEDGVIEAIEVKGKKFCLAVQWHPERINDESSIKIFSAFINEAKSSNKAR